MDPNFLKDLLMSGALIEAEKSNNRDEGPLRFRGANTPCFSTEKENFVVDDTGHCPRVAILRRVGIGTKKGVDSIMSFKYGAAWEELIKTFIDNVIEGGHSSIQYCEEEDAQVEIEDPQNPSQVLFSLRPDLLIKHPQWAAVVECKSVQSGGTAQLALTNRQPKLGAVLQWAAASIFHGVREGWTLYGMLHYTDHYDYATKQKNKYRPSFATHHCEIRGEDIYCESNKTVITVDSIISGIHMLREFHKMGQLPPMRPVQCDLYGRNMKYNICQFCEFQHVCLQFDGTPSINLRDFIEVARMEVDLNDNCEDF